MIGLFLFFLLMFPSPLISDTVSNARIFSSPLFPCSSCHGVMKPVFSRRKLSFHEDITLNHDNLWCLDCHNASNRDRLNKTGGKIITFNELQSLCGICHGVIYTEWTQGVHGKRTGYWNGEKHYLLCTDCHNPHSPRFNPLRPEPPPLRPEKTLRR